MHRLCSSAYATFFSEFYLEEARLCEVFVGLDLAKNSSCHQKLSESIRVRFCPEATYQVSKSTCGSGLLAVAAVCSQSLALQLGCSGGVALRRPWCLSVTVCRGKWSTFLHDGAGQRDQCRMRADL